MKIERVSWIVAVALLLFPTVVLADVITYPMDVQGMGLHDDVRITYTPAGFWSDTVNAGQILVNYRSQDYAGYCVDIFQHAGDGPVSEVSPTTLAHGDLAAWLFDTYAANVTTNTEAAALQVAIWEVLYEDPSNGYDVQHGTFRITSNGQAKQAAQDMLAAMPGSYMPQSGTVVLLSNSRQDLMISSGPGAGGGPIPEPGTIALLAFGGAFTALRRRRCA